MSDIEIKRFDANKLEELAKEQTRIYNYATEKVKVFDQAKTEDVIKRFKREDFDSLRMFYAFKGDKMIGYAGLTEKYKAQNSREVGFPWLDKDIDSSVRDLLYDGMEKQCQTEGTKTMRAFAHGSISEIKPFFTSKGFQVIQEFDQYQKDIEQNTFQIPNGYKIRTFTKDDIPAVVEISQKDPKLERPLTKSTLEQAIQSPMHKPENFVVAEYNGNVVSFYGIAIPADPKIEYCDFAGATTDPEHEDIEVLLLKELENRAFNRNKKKIRAYFVPESLRIPGVKEGGFKLIEKSYSLKKDLF